MEPPPKQLSHLNSQDLKKYHYTNDENLLWNKIFKKQMHNLHDKAFSDFFYYCSVLRLSEHRVPDLFDLNENIFKISGWQITPVNGLINAEEYFNLLSNRVFPIAIKLRTINEFNLSKDPDIFHDIFGHCSMLISLKYVNFLETFSKLMFFFPKKEWPLLSRILWFTTETGLIQTNQGIRIYGSSILSSYSEARYCLQSKKPTLKSFDLIEVLREPFRADILQSTYFVLNSQNQLYDLVNAPELILNAISKARKLGEYPPKFKPTSDKFTNYGFCTDK